MKLLRRIGLSVLIILFLAVGLCYAQNTAKQIYAKGVEYATQGKLEEAKEEFEKALKVDPFYESAKSTLKVIEDVNNQKIKINTAIMYFKGISYAVKGQWAEAISDYNKAIEINPSFATAYTGRGYAYLNKGQYDKAISDFNKAIEINPRDAIAYNGRGIAYYKKGQYDKAIFDYSKAIEINPRFANAYNNRGWTYHLKGQHDKAISDYDKAIEINPRLAMAYNNRGIAYDAKMNTKKACSDWKRACELGDCSSWGIVNKIKCLGK